MRGDTRLKELEDSKGSYYLSCFDLLTRKRAYFEVSEPVYVYVRQLEHKIARLEDNES